MSSEVIEDKEETESSTGFGFGALIAGVGALVISVGVAVQPAAASDDGLVRLLKGGTLPQTFGQNNINNGVGSLHRANLSSATQDGLLQLLLPLAGIVGVVNANRAGGFRRGW